MYKLLNIQVQYIGPIRSHLCMQQGANIQITLFYLPPLEHNKNLLIECGVLLLFSLFVSAAEARVHSVDPVGNEDRGWLWRRRGGRHSVGRGSFGVPQVREYYNSQVNLFSTLITILLGLPAFQTTYDGFSFSFSVFIFTSMIQIGLILSVIIMGGVKI